MSDRSGIEWCTSTVSAVRGCKPVSPGCLHCYAAGLAARFSGPGGTYEGLAEFRGKEGERRAHWAGKITLHPEQLALPLRWRKPRTIFWNHTSDTWHEDVPNEYIAAMFGVAAATPQHTHIFLTKRAAWLADWCTWAEISAHGQMAAFLGDHATKRIQGWGAIVEEWPLPNVIGMVSVEDRRHGIPRIEHLRQAPFAMRGLSIEPLLEDLGFLDLRSIDWVIVGGESGRHARPMHPDWVRSIRDQCVAAGVPFFFKQWGKWAPADDPGRPDRVALCRNGLAWPWPPLDTTITVAEHTSLPDENPTVMAPLGKDEAGAVLDGRRWAEKPQRFAA